MAFLLPLLGIGAEGLGAVEGGSLLAGGAEATGGESLLGNAFNLSGLLGGPLPTGNNSSSNNNSSSYGSTGDWSTLAIVGVGGVVLLILLAR